MMADVEFFNTRISEIDGSGDLGEQLVAVVKEKSVVQEASSVSSPTPSSESGSPAPKPTSPTNGVDDS